MPDPKLPALVLAAALASASATQAQDLLFEKFGRTDATNLGAVAAPAGDVNNDGVEDIIVGVERDLAGSQQGRAFVYSGVNGALLYTFVGAGPNGRFGFAVDGAGDVNNDGFDDVIVGQPNEGVAAVAERGRATIYSGFDGSIIRLVVGDGFGENLGTSVAGVGDVNGDGNDDVLIGSPGFDNDRGRARLYSGVDGSLLYTVPGAASGDTCGFEVAGLGDLNGDGRPEFAVGEPRNDTTASNAGRFRVFSGIDGTRLFTKRGDAAGDQLGRRIAAAGDLNGDGTDDFLASTPFTDALGSSTGSVFGFSGVDGTRLFEITGTAAASNFGASVDGVDDANGDGVADFIVGASKDDVAGSNAGAATLFSGATMRPLFKWFGEGDDEDTGVSVGGLADLDGDGLSEVLIGSPGRPIGLGGGSGATGVVGVFTGNDLYLTTSDPSPITGAVVNLDTTSGLPGTPTLLFVNSLDDVRCICRVGGVGLFDGLGERLFSAAVPPGLVGTEMVLQAFGVDGSGSLLDTAELHIEIE